MSVKKHLARLVSSQQPIRRGSVVSITENSIYVSSPNGLKEFQVESPSSFKVGDQVKFQGNNYLGRIPSNLASKVYVV